MDATAAMAVAAAGRSSLRRPRRVPRSRSARRSRNTAPRKAADRTRPRVRSSRPSSRAVTAASRPAPALG
jgi:hypothetical protein